MKRVAKKSASGFFQGENSVRRRRMERYVLVLLGMMVMEMMMVVALLKISYR